jgi:hypothetical protein
VGLPKAREMSRFTGGAVDAPVALGCAPVSRRVAPRGLFPTTFQALAHATAGHRGAIERLFDRMEIDGRG